MDGDQSDPDPQRRRVERLATLAELARPVQHELNNLLTVINANLEMIKRRVTDEASQRQVGRALEASRRFEASTRAILSLTRRPVPGEGRVSPAAAVASLEPLLAVLLPVTSLTVEVPPHAHACLFDQALLDEALIGLTRTAAEAKQSLHLRVDDDGSAVALRLSLTPGGPPPSSLRPLERLAREAGGTLSLLDGELLLTLPPATPREVIKTSSARGPLAS